MPVMLNFFGCYELPYSCIFDRSDPEADTENHWQKPQKPPTSECRFPHFAYEPIALLHPLPYLH